MAGFPNPVDVSALRRERAALALGAALNFAAALLTLAVVALAATASLGRVLIWGLNASAFFPQDYAVLGSMAAGVQIALGLFVVRATQRLSRNVPYLASTAMFVSLAGVGGLFLSALGAGGVLGAIAGGLTAAAGGRAWSKLAPHIWQPEDPFATNPRARWLARWSPVLTLGWLAYAMAILTAYPAQTFLWWGFMLVVAIDYSHRWSRSTFAARARLSARMGFAGGVVLALEGAVFASIPLVTVLLVLAVVSAAWLGYEVVIVGPMRTAVRA